MYNPASSASVADDITFLMMCAMFNTAAEVILFQTKATTHHLGDNQDRLLRLYRN
jgi:hypothetical protein